MASSATLATVGKKTSGCIALTGWQYGVPQLRPWHVVGLVDAEGCFCIVRGKPVFTINMNVKEFPLLEAIRKFFGGHGRVNTRLCDHTARVSIERKYGLLQVVRFFQDHHLWTTKWHDFQRWQRCVELTCSMEHRTEAGRLEIQTHNESMNRRKPPGLPTGLAIHGGSKSHPSDWISGFTSGEGCFSLRRRDCTLTFDLGQLSESVFVLEFVQASLRAGKIYHRNSGLSVLHASSAADLQAIQSFFVSHVLVGSKRADFQIWSDFLDFVVNARNSYGRCWRKRAVFPEALLHARKYSWNQAARWYGGRTSWSDIGGGPPTPGRSHNLCGTELYKSCYPERLAQQKRNKADGDRSISCQSGGIGYGLNR